MPFTNAWIQLVSIGINFAMLLVGIRLVRHLSNLEFKVDMMWNVFVRRFGDGKEKEGLE